MDDLKFLGCGSGFNPTLGSTAAYFTEDDKLFLIDCGDGTYKRIKELKLHENIKMIYFFCTHTHSDHIGSVGNLMLECFHERNIPFNLVIPKDAEHFTDVTNVLNAFGGRGLYNIVEPVTLRGFSGFLGVKYEKTTHGDCPAYSLVFYTNEGAVYYSGDSETMGFAEELIMGGAKIKAMYFDVSSNPNCAVHLPIIKLYQLMPREFRSRTYCMHFNDQKCIDMAKSMGFNAVTSV